ncbi:DUF1501 domain-containing protein [Lignipirellula cremea]|uniref:Sulfatase n=1 Tax=Lignipirellula cremea TaxID=2528010 RepID=A0A518E0J6_9BACT|nr:DUF1501 domain-containing protein [Lignipirellula cremea]QDU97614.1 hypothetical protein Pla8534_54640 [Lignipirellula cremea]
MHLDKILSLRHTRRAFLQGSAGGLGSAALASLLGGGSLRAAEQPALASRGVVQPLHYPPKAKRVIWLCQAGGMSHLESFDHKPKLAELNGQPMPESYTQGQPIAQLQGKKLTCFAPQHGFQKHGDSGQEICDIFPHLGRVADELCIVRSLHTEAINHDPAHTFMNTGALISGRPAMGSWLTYGLGNEADDLPGFVVLTSLGKAGQAQPIAARQWHSGFLPSRYQGVEFHSAGDPVLYVSRPQGISAGRQRDVVEAVNALNRMQDQLVDDPEISTRISQYELAFKMQTSVPELMDIADEPQSMLDAYGCQGADGTYASNCLLARRLAERGVRFIQLYHRGWDHHGNIKSSVERTAAEVDQATAALIQDLKQRDMLKDTLLVFGGEFGRTPMAQGTGRDHHIKGFSMFLAGGGVKPGVTYGATDELGYNAVENVVSVHDLHATMLHQLGVDHERLTFQFQGLDFKLTGVEEAHILHDILA